MARVTYTPIEWDINTPINVTNLDKMDSGISDVATALDMSTGTATTTPASTDIIPMQASNGNALKINYDDLAKAIIEQYTGSSLGGASQSIKTLLDAMNIVTTTTVNYTSNFTTYLTGSEPHFVKMGKVVFMYGAAKPTAEIAKSSTAQMFTIPEGFRPCYGIQQLCQGSVRKIWLLSINTEGVVTFGRMRNGADAEVTGTGDWLPFSVTYICQ